MKRKAYGYLLIAALTAQTLTGCGIAKIIKTGEEAAITGNVEFNAGDNVANFWESAAIPELEERATDLKGLLETYGEDMTKGAGETYAKYSRGSSGDLTYVVKGEGTISAVEKQKKAGYITLALDGYEGPKEIDIQIGSIFKGTSVRDGLNFIDFNDYTNQVEWGQVATSINQLVQQDVIDPIGYDAIEEGKKVSFTGVFTVSKGDQILITPVEMTVE